MPEASKLQPEPEFVSISRASQLLGVSERTVRRVAGQMPDTDRQKRQGSPALIRLSALAFQMGRSDLLEDLPDTPDTSAGHAGQKKAAVPDTPEEVAGLAGHNQDSLVEHLRSELESLKQDREHWREQADKWEAQAEKSLQLVDQAQRLQLAAQHRVAELEGKLLPPAGDSSGDTVPGDLPAPRMGSGGGITTLESVETVKAPGETTKLQPWWAFWKGRA